VAPVKDASAVDDESTITASTLSTGPPGDQEPNNAAPPEGTGRAAGTRLLLALRQIGHSPSSNVSRTTTIAPTINVSAMTGADEMASAGGAAAADVTADYMYNVNRLFKNVDTANGPGNPDRSTAHFTVIQETLRMSFDVLEQPPPPTSLTG
jgi:hypothetical protein